MFNRLTRCLAIMILAIPFLHVSPLNAQNWNPDRDHDRDHRDDYRRGDRDDRYRGDRDRDDGWRQFGYRGGYGSASDLGYRQGYRDGFDKGDQDSRKHRRPDVRRHDRYDDADHGYKKQFGPKAEYRYGYRQGFEQGYREAFRGSRRY